MEKREDYKRPSLNSTDSIRTEFSLGTTDASLARHFNKYFVGEHTIIKFA